MKLRGARTAIGGAARVATAAALRCRPTKPRAALLAIGAAVGVMAAAGCSRSEATGTASVRPPAQTAPAADCAGHAVCAADFVIDAASQPCSTGSRCTIAIDLVARSDFHINDDYPYRFKADEGPGLRFDGTDAAGKNVFSKPAGDWQKVDAKNGVMKIHFTPLEKGSKTVGGTFKLSVCSPETCLLEQRQVSARVVVN